MRRRDDVKVNLSGTRWKWTDSDPWPPLSSVLDTALWKADEYAALRERLRKPVPSPEVRYGGEFLTIDLHGAKPAAAAASSGAASIPAETPETPTTAQASRGAKRAAQAVERYGLVHITGLAPGSPLPAALQGLEYRAVLVEVGPGDFGGGVHALIPKLLLKGVPILLAGAPADVSETVQYVRAGLHGEQVFTVDIILCRPGHDAVYRYRGYVMQIMSRAPLQFKVRCVV